MPGPGQRVKYPRGLRRLKKTRKSKGKMKALPRRDDDDMSPEGPPVGGTGGGGTGGKPPWGGSKGGRVGKSSGGSVSSRLSKSGPVAKPN